jgi:hypothetical protein
MTRKEAIQVKRLLGVVAMCLLLWPVWGSQLCAASQNENSGAEDARRERQMYQDRIEGKLHYLDQRIDALKGMVGKQNRVDRVEIKQ